MILPGAKLGVFGNGQLGRMFTRVASRMGYQVYAYSPEKNSPASKAGAIDFIAAYEDKNFLLEFLSNVDAVTFEFENIPAKTLQIIKDYTIYNRYIPCRPSVDSILIAQHRIREKDFFRKIGLKTVNYFPVLDKAEVLGKLETYEYPAILKTNTLGYDGKGQWKVSKPIDLKKIIESLDRLDHVLESKLEFEKELSVIVARFASGKILTYFPSENIHKNHILDLTIHPARTSKSILNQAMEMGKTLAESLDYVGILGLEFFLKDGELYCNEFAPRPHNSGHFSMDFYPISQFDLQLLTLVDCEVSLSLIPASPVVMKNIVGPDFFQNPNIIQKFMQNSDYKLHLYQKEEIKPGRKLGHINFNGEFSPDIFPW